MGMSRHSSHLPPATRYKVAQNTLRNPKEPKMEVSIQVLWALLKFGSLNDAIFISVNFKSLNGYNVS
jgi:hypothetical protein